MHVKVRRHDQLVEKSYSRDAEPGETSVPVLLVFNRGKKRNTRNKLHGKNEATGEQRAFTSSPDHVGIYPWIATEAAKSDSHAHAQAVEMKTYLDWIWDVTGILYCKHQTHNWTPQEHKAHLPGGAQQTQNAWRALEQRDANVAKWPLTYSSR